MKRKRTAIEIILSLTNRVSGPLDQINDLMDKAKNKTEVLQKALDKVGDVGKKVAATGAVMAASITTLGVVGVRQFARVADKAVALRSVITSTMGSVGQSMVESLRAARHWSDNHIQSMEQWIDTAYIAAGAGLNDVQAISATNTALGLATTSLASNGAAIDTLTDVYLNFGDANAEVGGEMDRLADRLLVTQQRFKLANLEQLQGGLSMGIGAVGQTGLDQGLAALGALNTSGIKGTSAGTAFSATIRQMNKASAKLGFTVSRTAKGQLDFIGTLENIRRKYGDITAISPSVRDAFQTAFGDEGLRAIDALVGKTDEMRAHMTALGESGGAVQALLPMFEETPGSQWTIFMNQVRNMLVDIGEVVAPAALGLLDALKPIVTWLAAMVKKHPGLTKFALAFGVVAGGALMALGGLLILSSAVGGLLVNMYILSTVIGPTGSVIVGLGNMARATGVIIRMGLVKSLGLLKGAIFAVGRAMLALAANPVVWIIAGIILLGVAVYLLVKHWDKVKGAMGRTWNYLTGLFSKIKEKLAGVPSWVLFFVPIFGIPALIIKHWDSLKAFFKILPKWFMAAGRGLVNAFVNGIKAGWGKAISTVSGLLARIKRFLTQSDAKEGPLKNLTWMGRQFPATYAAGITQGAGDLETASRNAMGRAAPQKRAVRVSGGNRVGAIHIHVEGGSDNVEDQVERGLARALNRFSYAVGG